MSEDPNSKNLLYFESATMRGLYEQIKEWQEANQKRLLSLSVERDGGAYCCLALTNPMEVVICDASTAYDAYPQRAIVSGGRLLVG